MDELEFKKISRWIEKLQDTGKRNRLINFRDLKVGTAEIVFPSATLLFSECNLGTEFNIFDVKSADEDDDEVKKERSRISREEYIDRYSRLIRHDNQLLMYSQSKNPVASIRKIGKKAKDLLDESGINATYIAFGFVRWNEREDSTVFYDAPLLLVHVTINIGSVLDPITIEVCDDDVIVNPTFNYLLQNNYGFSLPEYRDGDSLSTYLSSVRRLVDQLGWSVVDASKIGIFSFLKINMYEDLKKNIELVSANRNIKALLGGQLDSDWNKGDNGAVVKNPVLNLHNVVDADSSQIEAIQMARSGKSFVLQGPPGTGKSQTITNIIAELLFMGKTVLFVSEKQAALNVVYDKLKKTGLSDFCLELHSHKANKGSVIAELNRTLELPHSRVSSDAVDDLRSKRDAQKALDGYAIELHKKRLPIEKSLYQLYEMDASLHDVRELDIVIDFIDQKGQEYFQRTISLLEQYSDYIDSIGYDYKENSLYGFKDVDLPFNEMLKLKQGVVELCDSYERLIDLGSEISRRVGLDFKSYYYFVTLQPVFEFIARSKSVTPLVLKDNAYINILPIAYDMYDLSKTICEVEDRLFAKYQTEITTINGRELNDYLLTACKSPLNRVVNKKYKKYIETANQLSTTENKVNYHWLLLLSNDLIQLQDAYASYSELEKQVQVYLEPNYHGVRDTDWDSLIPELQKLNEFNNNPGIESYGDLSDMYYAEFDKCRTKLQNFSNEIVGISSALDGNIQLFEEYVSDEVIDLRRNSLAVCYNKLRSIRDDFDSISNWLSFIRVLDAINDEGLSAFIQRVIDVKLPKASIVDVYRKTFINQWIHYILYSVPELSRFNRIAQDQAVTQFVSGDLLQYKINKAVIQAELSKKRPDLSLVAGGSAIAILRREGQKKRKQMPIRVLFESAREVIQAIKPCFLMSPLSVSTFLDPDVMKFDTIIFDEASQIFPQDAIGSIYRGDQVIVVGDSKQMPPSNFFNSTLDDDDDEDYDDVTDFESILDVCSSVFTNERLTWHYRSRYEQLIAFSNFNFYGNRLMTFPSASKDHTGIGVDYYFANGVFDRQSKTNRVEAEFIVDLVFKNIKEHPDRSLGVVAFSVAQQSLIDSLIIKRREEDPSFEDFFCNDNQESFFVKNLETVQGDERDTIIFSIAYARDDQGRFILNFGPLNREGGERRLNVAVTRAKENVQLVASIHYTDIDLTTSSSKSEGVRLLRAYLDYAENGEIALKRLPTVAAEDHYDSYFEEDVCEYLRGEGYTVDTQVGCSGYKIDMAVRIPDSSNYVLAIECDGATYHSSRNARDRDRLRQSILENMGWSFYRIWSTDWYRNNAVEKRALLTAVENALKGKDKVVETKVERKHIEKKDEAKAKSYVVEKEVWENSFPKYKKADEYTIMSIHRQDFLSGIQKILEIEGPIAEEFLIKRLLYLFNSDKVTQNVRKSFAFKMRGYESRGIIWKDGFLYLKGKKIQNLRVPGYTREIKYISHGELALGFYSLLKQNQYADKDGLYKTMTNLLGYSRTGEMIARRYNIAIQILLNKKLIKYEGNTLSLNDDTSSEIK